MQTRPHSKPYKFFAEFERMEPMVLDHTAIIAAKECMRKYFFQIVLGSRGRGPEQPYFGFGSAYHKFREVLEIGFLAGEPNSISYPKAMAAAVAYYNEKFKKPVEVGDKWDFLTRDRLINSCVKAYEWWKIEKAAGKIVVLAVEQPFNVQIGNSNGEFTGGRFDQIVRWNGKVYGRDFKTSSKEGAYYARGLDPNDQFTRYTYAEQKLSGTRVEGQIIEVLYNAKKSGPTITPYIAGRSQFQLDDWEADELFMRETIARAREQDRWPKQEHHCTFCNFHSVCKMGTEGAQKAKLKQEFTQVPWDFMSVHLLDSEK